MGRGATSRPLRYERCARRLKVGVRHKRNVGIFRARTRCGEHRMNLPAMMGLVIEDLHQAQGAIARLRRAG